MCVCFFSIVSGVTAMAKKRGGGEKRVDDVVIFKYDV